MLVLSRSLRLAGRRGSAQTAEASSARCVEVPESTLIRASHLLLLLLLELLL